ncbi:hypothetical protein GCM10010191_14310 [Actinomadura vinacea]|uniref:Uncharacterized protein n=1 Tax=Actinomadura vinacea TaxID=115336 RepID=A0ABN3IKF0_9ACTN
MNWLNASFEAFGEHILWTGLAGVPPALKPGPYVSAAVYGVFFVMVMIGFRDWHREARAQNVQNPRHEAVAP